MPQVPLSAESIAALDQVEAAAQSVGRSDVTADVAWARVALRQAAAAREQIDRLRAAVPLPIVELPQLPAARMDADVLGRLGALAAGGVA